MVWPFPVTSATGQNCTLELPISRTRRSPTFHIKYLRPYQTRVQNGPTASPVTENQIATCTDDITRILCIRPSPAAAEVRWRNCEYFDISWVTLQLFVLLPPFVPSWITLTPLTPLRVPIVLLVIANILIVTHTPFI